MSTDTERVESETTVSTLETLERWYHVPVLGLVMLFMLWTRLQSYDRVAMADGEPRLSAVDSWYHWRTVQWTAENYPYTMPFDIWTSFPTGRYVGQFGTLFDQLIVTAAMIVGLGSPSTETLYTVAIVAVPVMAALVALPVFFIGRRLGGTLGGLVAVVVLALSRGQFLSRSTVGQLQHHVAEVLFMAIAVLAMMVALRVAEQDRPIWELVEARDWDTLRRPTIYSALAGFATGLYIWVWPPGVVLVGIFGTFFVVSLCVQYLRGRSPDHLAFVAAVSMGVTTIMTLALLEEPGSSPTSFSYIQPLTAGVVAIGAVFMAWLARQWDGRSLQREYYPAAIVGIMGASLLVMAVVLPDIFNTILDNLYRRLIPFGATATDATISEAQRPDNFANHVFNEFGAAFFTMLGGLAFLLIRPLFGREWRTEYTLIVVWTLFLTSMAATQIRFAYYLVLAVAVLNAVFVADIARLLQIDFHGSAQQIREIETYQVIAIFLVVMMLFMPLLPPIAGPGATAWDRGAAANPSGDAVVWDESTQWMLESTPESGNWAGAGNQSQLEYYGTYEYPDDGDYDYPVGAYGVMSWWDYGHLITTNAERMPHSNPFQSNARSSSWYLLAQEEAHGEAILDGVAADVPVVNRPLEQIEADLEGESGHEEIRYVMIDDQMAGGKFSAITEWTETEYEQYAESDMANVEGQELEVSTTNEQYRNTMLASLYLDDAEGMEHYRLVHESNWFSIVGSEIHVLPNGQAFDITVSSERFGAPTGYNEQIQNIDAMLEGASAANEATLFQQNYQIEGMLTTQYVYNAEVVSSVKTFERVDGATISGIVDGEVGDADRVYAQVELETNAGRTFTYTQQAEVNEDGTYELTVPYATDNTLGPDDGYADSAVTATDNAEYEVFVGTPEDGEIEREYLGTTDVPETAVVDGETIELVLEPGDGEVVPDPDAEPEPPEADPDANDEGVGEEDGETDADDANDSDDETENANDNETDNNTTDARTPMIALEPTR
ncbi:oligosaccharyl transferase, archaeosortase A system-associated [Natronosalvus vescus]|uniref:oligosaccharyl transferase, archaeosortase A system-associated n=1 Tax=Natronosalvus vescus TaxID=2953881 RepID=UPI002091D5CE|nr:oligosaccharyl transferase, archaeosortase A system-associated [Natronosalvus vescus]